MDEINIKNQIAENITLLRKSRDMNQSQLGAKLGYSDKSISKWELKETIPDVYTLEKIAKMFDVTIDDLINSHHIVRKSHKKKNRLFITILSMLGPLLFAAIAYLVLEILHVNKSYIVWIASASLSGIVGVVFSSLWYKSVHLILSTYLIIWPLAIICMIFLNFRLWWVVLIVAIILSISFFIGFNINAKKKNII